MKLKMAKNSIFAILLRSRWWISALIALAFIVVAKAALPPQYFAAGAFGALPFIVISGISLYRKLKAPSDTRVEQVRAAVAAQSWNDFAQVLQAGFVQDGCEVKRLPQGPVDFELRRQDKLAVVSAKRWKASRVGVEPLRELAAAGQARGAHECIYVALGEVSEQAGKYARDTGIQLVDAQRLALVLPKDFAR